MSTAAQFAANRANAESSTGPTTEAGKKASGQNALKHGLACGRLLIPGENPEEFKKLKADLRREHRPSGLTEDLLVEKMAHSLWFARRAVICQAAAFTDAPENEPIPEKLGILLRYQTSNERAFYKALQTLQALRKERRQNSEPEPPASKVQLSSEEIGFVLNATPEQIWEHLVEQHKKQYPHEPFPEFSPDEKEKLIDSLR